MGKLKAYLKRQNFEEYFRHPNQTGEEELVREKLLESDFPVGVLSGLTLEGFLTLIIIVLIKYLLFMIGG